MDADVRNEIKGRKEGWRKRERCEKLVGKHVGKLERVNEIMLLKSPFVALPSVHPFDRSSDKEVPAFVFSWEQTGPWPLEYLVEPFATASGKTNDSAIFRAEILIEAEIAFLTI